MKPCALLLTLSLCCSSLLLFGQEWLGTQFQLDTSVTLTHADLPHTHSQLKCDVKDDVFYFTDMKSFQRKSSDFSATIYAVDLETLEQFTVSLPFPNHTQMKEQTASTYWINDFSIEKDRIVISVQDNMLIYNRNTDGSCVFDTLFYHPRVKVLYLFQNDLYYLEEDHENGYIWFQRKNLYGSETEIGRLKYDAPHVVQANPNRYLFHTDDALFFLNTRYPQFEKYSLNGKKLQTVQMNLPMWHPFEEEYIRKSLEIPYGVERIQATMGEIFKYSYPKMLFPMGNDYLLFYTQYDSVTQRSKTHYAIVDDAGKSHLFSRYDTSNAVFDGTRYPFNFLDRFADVARISWRDKLVELCLDSDVDWNGLTPEEFKNAEEQFYKKNKPKLKIRIQTYKNNSSASNWFYDTEQNLLSLDELPNRKHIILVNQPLECSGCRNQLLQFLNTIDTSVASIGILYPTIQGALQQYELDQSIREYLSLPYRLLSLEPDRKDEIPRYNFPSDLSYPALLFHESGKAPILFSSNQIFDDDFRRYDFRTEFLNFIERFFDTMNDNK